MKKIPVTLKNPNAKWYVWSPIACSPLSLPPPLQTTTSSLLYVFAVLSIVCADSKDRPDQKVTVTIADLIY